jgi:hypothetical protein
MGLSRRPGGTPGFTLVSGNVRVFSRMDLCYNTGHEADPEFNWEFVRFRRRTEGG